MAKMNIEAERARLGMTKIEMCEILGVTTSTYLSYIRGKRPIPSDVLEKLHDLTGKSVDYLIGLAE